MPEPIVLPAEYGLPCVGSVHESLLSLRSTITLLACAFLLQDRSISLVGVPELRVAVCPLGLLIALTSNDNVALVPLAPVHQVRADDAARTAPADDEEGADDEGQGTQRDPVSLRQRAAPFIDMLRRSAAEAHDVVW